MSVIIFIIILGVLIFVHELGHFLVAKKSGIRVDEFAIGFPPQIFSFKKGGTKYALNLIPFGGYVKIYGENSEDESVDKDAKDSFVNKSPWIQAAVLIAGVTFNIVFAWFLFLIVLMAGSPTIVDQTNRDFIKDAKVTITNVYEKSPAGVAGLKSGDNIISISSTEKNSKIEKTFTGSDVTVKNVQDTIANSDGSVKFGIERIGQKSEISINPQEGIVGDKQAIGVSLEEIGTYALPIHKAFLQSFVMTGNATQLIAVNLVQFLGKAVIGHASLNEVSGPVGIVGIVGEAAQFGFIYLLSFTAFISINLAVLNVLPLPALDGGRLVMVLIEGVTKRKIKPTIVNWVNGLGFLFLILLMIVITVNDVIKLF
jgi:regulator of sigma E protease